MAEVKTTGLGCDQFGLGGPLACSRASVYFAQHLIYSETPTWEGLAACLERACRDWRESRTCEDMDVVCEELLDSERTTRSLLCPLSETSGLNLPRALDRSSLPPEILSPDLGLSLSLADCFFDFCRRAAATLEPCRGVAMTVTCGGGTLCVAAKRLRTGGLRFDLVDSHRRYVGCARGEALWACTTSPLEMADLLEALLPPAEGAAERLSALVEASRREIERDRLLPPGEVRGGALFALEADFYCVIFGPTLDRPPALEDLERIERLPASERLSQREASRSAWEAKKMGGHLLRQSFSSPWNE